MSGAALPDFLAALDGIGESEMEQSTSDDDTSNTCAKSEAESPLDNSENVLKFLDKLATCGFKNIRLLKDVSTT
jgi:hypothetical protein